MLKDIRTLINTVFVALIIMLNTVDVLAGDELITDIRLEGLYSMDGSEFLDLFGIRIHDGIDERAAREGIKRTFLTNRFEDIIVERDDKDASRIIIKVKERSTVRRIKVKGLVNLRKKDIIKNFPIKKYSYFHRVQLKPAIEKLKSAIVAMGYPDAIIGSEVDYLADDPFVVITLKVDEGHPLVIKKVVIHGIDDPEEIERIILKMKIFPGDIYNSNLVIKRLTKLKEYYKSEGRYNPAIGPFTFSDGILDININMGKRLVLKIKGNTHFSDSALIKEMPFRDAESIRNELIEEASSRIITRYRGAGFAFAQIAPVIEEEEDSVEIVFIVYEGGQVYVEDIHIEGNSVDSEKLKEIVSLKEGSYFNPDNLERDRETLREFYYALGYFDAAIDEITYEYDESNTLVSLFIKISEGTRSLIGSVEFEGNRNIFYEELFEAVSVRPLMPYNEIDISDSRYSIMNLYKRKGYLNAEVDVKRRFGENRVFIVFDIHEGSRYFFGYTIIRGNRRVKSRVITRQLVTEKGEPFDALLLRKNTQKLYKLGLFSDVDYKIVDDTGQYKSVIMDVKEANAGAVEFGIGYGDYERYRGYLDISYRNFFGMNRQAKIRTELTTISERFIIGAFEPWLFRFPGAYGPLTLGIDLVKERRTEKNLDTGDIRYKVSKYSATGKLEMNFAERVKGSLLYSYSLVDTYSVEPEVELSKEDTGTLAISAVTPGIIYDSRDNPFNPKTGILAGLTFGIATHCLLSETDFVKTVFYGSFYRSLSRRFTAAVSFRGGFAEGYRDTDELPIIERFFLGGRDTVRGYKHDSLGPKSGDEKMLPVGGNAFLMNNFELRIDVGRRLGIVTFMDGGNVWIDSDDIDPGDFRYTTGAGLRYMTPVGPIRLDYGYKLNKEKEESEYEIHFSIGHAF